MSFIGLTPTIVLSSPAFISFDDTHVNCILVFIDENIRLNNASFDKTKLGSKEDLHFIIIIFKMYMYMEICLFEYARLVYFIYKKRNTRYTVIQR